MTDQRTLYRYWRAELASPGSQSRDTADTPTDGFWRAQAAKTKPDYPVAIWHEGEVETIKIGRRQFDGGSTAEGHDFRDGTWQHCVAVTKEIYDAAVDTGFWPDGKPARKMSDEERMGIEVGGGDNAPSTEDSLGDQIASLADIINNTDEPKTQDEANALAGRLDKMRALLKLAEAARVKEKEPDLQGGREVDAKWQAIGQPGGDAYRDGEAKRKAFLKKEQARLDAEAEERRKQQQAEIEAQQAAAAAEAAERGEPVPAATPAAAVVPPAEPQRARAGSTFGRATGLRKVTRAKITDIGKLLQALSTHKEMIEFAQTLANRAAKAGIPLDGMEIEEVME